MLKVLTIARATPDSRHRKLLSTGACRQEMRLGPAGMCPHRDRVAKGRWWSATQGLTARSGRPRGGGGSAYADVVENCAEGTEQNLAQSLKGGVLVGVWLQGGWGGMDPPPKKNRCSVVKWNSSY